MIMIDTQPFDPVDFYRIAQKIFQESDKFDSSAARTCIGRAYYSAFLVARDRAKVTDQGKETHQAVIAYYKKKKPVVGNRLHTLREQRNDADYNMARIVVQQESGKALKLCAEILKHLGCVV